MASGRSKSTTEKEQMLEQYCAVTGTAVDSGRPLLEACNWDLEMAIGMHMDGGGNCETPPPDGNMEAASQSTESATSSVSDNIRAPIPQKREVLIDQYPGYIAPGRRRGARSVFDAFRDFQAETRQAEERARRGEVIPRAPPRKRRTLEELFRPPVDLVHKGSFNSAKEAGTAANKWLLVNVQNVQEFNCQVLNRDVWSNRSVRDLINKHFLFWQVYSDSEDGKRYMQFYNILKWPYMAIVDPQTGEKFVEWNDVDMKTVLELMNVFLADHPFPDSSLSSPPAKKARRDNSQNDIVDASEDSQLKAAIQASLHQTKSSSTIVLSSDSDQLDSSDDEIETFSDSGSDSGSALVQSSVNPGTNLDNVHIIDSESRGSCTSGSKSSSSLKHGASKKSKGKQSKNSQGVVKNGKCREEVDESSRTSAQTEDRSNDSSRSSLASSTVPPSSESWQDFLGSQQDEKTKLLIRYPDGRREALTVPCTSKLKAVTLYISQQDIDLTRHELVTNFPRRNISEISFDQTLKDSGIHPQETIFVQEKS